MGCTGGPLAPQCDRETGTVLEAGATVGAGATAQYDVISPRHSNLIMVLTWPDPSATLALRATMTACGEHVGCQVGLVTSSMSAGPGSVRLLVDGTRGKRYVVDVIGDATRDQSFTLRVTFDTGICT
jgi:hypothetical protein